MQNWTKWGTFLVVLATLFGFSQESLNGATWYIDRDAAGLNNGTSWANAYRDITALSSVAPGDIVNISGGQAGSSKEYVMGSAAWQIKSGTPGNPITYRIGQDPGHNGKVVFIGSDRWLTNTLHHAIVSGDAGDGECHIVVRGYSMPIHINRYSNTRISYIDLGQPTSNSGGIYSYQLASVGPNFELDHCRMVMWGPAINCAMQLLFTGGAWDANRVHHNYFAAPTGGNAIGADGIKTGGTGYSIYNNHLEGYATNYTASQHSDGWQCGGSEYVKVYNNFVTGFNNIGLYCEIFPGGSSMSHVWIYNNVLVVSWLGICVATDNGAGKTFTDCIIANNVVRNSGSVGAINMNSGAGTGGTWIDCLVANNITINGGINMTSNPNTPVVNNVRLTDSTAQALFVYFNPAGTNSDFHLVSSAINAIDRGTNLFGYFTTDRDGYTRGSAWDIGPYEYRGGSASTNPIIVADPPSFNYGALLRDTSATNAFTVRNVGGGTLAGAATVTGAFSIVGANSYSLGAGQSQTIQVRYTPSGSAVDSANLVLSGGGGAVVPLSGGLLAVQPGLTFEAASGSISAPFVASGGFVSQSIATGLSGGGRAVYAFNIPSAGQYAISAMVNAPNTTANSLFVNIDGEPTDPAMIWDIPVTTGGAALRQASWRGAGTAETNQFIPAVFSLSAGVHQLVIRGREAGVQIGTISIAPPSANRPLAPEVSTPTQNVADADESLAGLQVMAGTTVQYSAMASDPGGNPLTWEVLFLLNGSANVVGSGTGSVISATYTYPLGSAGSGYRWVVRVSNGFETVERLLDVAVIPAPVVELGLSFEAEAGAFSSPFVLSNGCLVQPITTASASSGGKAVYSFTVPVTGNYAVEMVVSATSSAGNSLFVNINGEPVEPDMIWDIPVTPGFSSRYVAWRGSADPDVHQVPTKSFALAAGKHQLIIRGREANVQIDRISIQLQPPAQSGLRVISTQQ